MDTEHQICPEMVICGCKENKDLIGGFIKQVRNLDVK